MIWINVRKNAAEKHQVLPLEGELSPEGTEEVGTDCGERAEQDYSPCLLLNGCAHLICAYRRTFPSRGRTLGGAV